MRFSRVLMAAVLAAQAGIVVADVPTAQEECVQRNLAVCEFATGVRSHQPGPCPVGARTLQPQGTEECGATRYVTPAGPATVSRTAPGPVSEPAVPGIHQRWQLTYLINGVAVLSLSWALWRWRRSRRRASGLPRTGAMAWCFSAGVGAASGWMAAATVFRRVFDSYGNHDSAAPLLLAAPAWLLTFTLVSSAVCALLLVGWQQWQKRE